MRRPEKPGPAVLLRVLLLSFLGLAAAWAWSLATRGANEDAPQDPASREEGRIDPHGPTEPSHRGGDVAPGDEQDVTGGLKGYSAGLGLAAALTALSFAMPGNPLVWGPAIPAALIVFAIAQMGVHLVFFLHINTDPDHTNNVMALAFGLVIVLLLIGGSLWIMAHLNQAMMPMDRMMPMQR